MTTQHYKRPSAGYTGEVGLPNRAKYQDDSTASPKVPVSSLKVDGDINMLVDAVNELYDTAVTGVVADGSITNVKIAARAGVSVMGRAANTTGDVADIVASANDQVLVRKGNTVQFSTVATGGIEDAAVTSAKLANANVTFAKIQNVNNGTLAGRVSSGTGPLEALAAGNGLVLSSGTVAVASATDTVAGISELATSAEVATGTDTSRVASVATSAYHKGAAKAWVNMNGTGTIAIRSSYNVSSIVDNGVGAYTVNFTTPMATNNYCVVVGENVASGYANTSNSSINEGNARPYNLLNTSCSVSVYFYVVNVGQGGQDAGLVTMAVFGEY